MEAATTPVKAMADKKYTVLRWFLPAGVLRSQAFRMRANSSAVHTKSPRRNRAGPRGRSRTASRVALGVGQGAPRNQPGFRCNQRANGTETPMITATRIAVVNQRLASNRDRY